MRYALVFTTMLLLSSCRNEKEQLATLEKVVAVFQRYERENKNPAGIKIYTAVFADRKITDRGTKSEGPSYLIVPKDRIYPTSLMVDTAWVKVSFRNYFPYKLNKEYVLVFTDFTLGPLVLEKNQEVIDSVLKALPP